MNTVPGVIELHGQLRKVIHKDDKYINFTFSDDNLGVLTLKACRKECPLFFNIDWNKKYHLRVKLYGKLRVNADGSETVFNNLQVKEILVE